MLRKSPGEVTKALIAIFNASISAGAFPSEWKHAQVTPVFKKGDLSELGNYRPISLLPIVSKVLERLIDEQLRNFLDRHGIIDDAQHGFRRSHSCETALVSLSQKLFSKREQKNFSCVTAIEFYRAFNIVDHTVLTQLMDYLCDALSTSWFRSFLIWKTQSVKYCDTLSYRRTVTSGTPEGSVLAPSLFVIYINSLFSSLGPDFAVACADDVTLVSSGSTFEKSTKRAEEALARLLSWTKDYGLYRQPFKVLHHDCLSISTKDRCSLQQSAYRWRRCLRLGHMRNAATGSRIHVGFKMGSARI